MNASDVMTTPVICVTRNTNIADVTRLMLKAHVSGLPVVNDEDEVVGIVCEGDLLRHETAGVNAPAPRSRWVDFFADPKKKAEDYIKQHARRAEEVMTTPVVTATPGASLPEIADMMEKHDVKRVPVVRQNRIVGIISRADLLRQIAHSQIKVAINDSDNELRERVKARINDSGVSAVYLSVFVDNGSVELTGLTNSAVERDAIVRAAETAAGVQQVVNSLRLPVNIMV